MARHTVKRICVAAAVAAACWAALAEAAAPQKRAKEGVALEFSAAPARGSPASAPMEGELVELRFKLTDQASGQPLRGNVPGAWLDIGESLHGRLGAQQKSCHDKVGLYLRGIVGIRPMLDLNSFYVMVLNRDASVSVVDPSVSLAGATSTLARIVLPGRGTDWAQAPDGKRIYVSIPELGKVAVIDTDTFKLAASIEAGPNPTRVAVQPDGRYVWVGNDADGIGGVTVIDAETLKPVEHLSTGKGHHEVAFSGDSRVGFVTNRESGTVSLIDVRKLVPLRDIAVSRMPLSVAFSSLAHVVYVADGKEGVVTVLGGPDFAPLKRIALRPGLGPMRFTQDGRFAMVVNTYEDLVHVIDASSNELVHDIPVKGQPYQLAFTRAFAYVRALASERVTMINLLSLGRGKKPIVQSFVAGAVPPKAAGDLPLADSITPVNIDAAVLIVNPADNTTYYYMEGMNAPSSNYQSYGAAARAVTVVDRGLKETAPGVYSSKVRIPAAGRYDVALFLNSPQIIECFSLEVKANPALDGAKRGVVARFLTESREVALGATVPVRVKLTGVDGKPQSGLTDVRMLSFLVPGQRREERLAREVEPGVYEAKLKIPEHGAYEVYVSSHKLGKQYRDLAFLSLRTARPDLEARIQQRIKEAKR